MKDSMTEKKPIASARSWKGKNVATGEEVARAKGSQDGVKNFSYELRKDGSHEVFHDGVSQGRLGPYGEAGSANTEKNDEDTTDTL